MIIAQPGPGANADGAVSEESLRDENSPELQRIIRRQLEILGEDAQREGLLRTPERVEKSLRWLTRGHAMSVQYGHGFHTATERHEQLRRLTKFRMQQLDRYR